MRTRLANIVTALVVFGVCGPVVLRGVDIVRFAAAEADLATDGNVEAVRSWGTTSGLGFSARASSLSVVQDWNDAAQTAKRRDEQVEILTVRPLSSEYWLLLSDMRLITGFPVNKVAEAFALSALTGANEHNIMVQRGIFGIAHWELLPAELQTRTANDVVEGPLSDYPFSDRVTNQLKRLLARKTDEVRTAIRTALQAHRVSAKGLAAIGL